ncbi:hypothetical protein RSOL_312200, partial [Rhizoctonia solani AG-3 Rhs1AP]
MDDRRFPGRDYGQIASLGDAPQEWAVDRITSHKGKGRKAIFELLWKTGDRTWEPYRTVRHLEALDAYCEAQGVKNAGKLPKGLEGETATDEPEETQVNHIRLENIESSVEKEHREDAKHSPPSLATYSLTNTCKSSQPTHPPAYTMSSSDQTAHILETAMELQRKSNADNNNAIIRVVELLSNKANGKRRTHRQRKAIAATVQHANADPARRNRKNRKGKKGANVVTNPPATTAGPSGSAVTATDPADWSNIGFGAPITTDAQLDLLSITDNTGSNLLQMPQIPVPEYTPDQTSTSPIKPLVQEPLVKQPETPSQTAPTHSTSESNLNTPLAPTAGQNPLTLTQGRQEEEELDYEDYNMDTTGGNTGNI